MKIKYSWALKLDGIPYPVDRPGYDKSIKILQYAVEKAKIEDKDKFLALKKLAQFK